MAKSNPPWEVRREGSWFSGSRTPGGSPGSRKSPLRRDGVFPAGEGSPGALDKVLSVSDKGFFVPGNTFSVPESVFPSGTKACPLVIKLQLGNALVCEAPLRRQPTETARGLSRRARRSRSFGDWVRVQAGAWAREQKTRCTVSTARLYGSREFFPALVAHLKTGSRPA